MTSNSDRDKYKKYKALAVQLNGKYLKHKNMNRSLREQLHTLQNGGSLPPNNPVMPPPIQESKKNQSGKNANQNSDAPLPNISTEDFKKYGLDNNQ